MNRTRIKFCGITRPQDAAAAAAAGVDAIGLVMDPASPRFIEPARAAMIRRLLPPFVDAVLLFRNADPDAIQHAITAVQPSLLQFHGDEPPELCGRFGLPYLRAVPMKRGADVAGYARRFAAAAALLLDAHAPGEVGGQGRTFEWSVVPSGLSRPIVLAGGLTPENVASAVRTVRPYAVDVSSGIEAAPGVKDPDRMRRFAAAVRYADEAAHEA